MVSVAMKPTIIHIIQSLARGGTETLLVGVIKAMPQYEHRIISLQKRNEFPGELDESIITYLNLKGYASLPKLVLQVRALLKPFQGKAIVHAHMFWANIISRFAVPRNMPLFNSYHSMAYGREGANYPLHAVWLDRYSYQKRVYTLCVSGAVKENIARYINIHDRVEVLHNYIEAGFYREKEISYVPGQTLRLVAVGNLKSAKNYDLALEALHLLNKNGKAHLCTLDIFGAGPLEAPLKKKAHDWGLANIRFMGLVTDVAARLVHYDAYLLTSSNEGFGIAVAEAMASGLPVLVSDLPVLREVTGGHALFFDIQDSPALAAHIEAIYEGRVNLRAMVAAATQQAARFSKDNYIHRLGEIYQTGFKNLRGSKLQML